MTNPAIGILIVDSGTGPIPLWYGHDVRPEDHENHICACCPASSILAGSCCLIQKCYRKKIAKLGSRFSEQQKWPLKGLGTLLGSLAGTAVVFRFFFYGRWADG